MVENPKLEDMGSESSATLSSYPKACELDQMGTQKISVSDQTNRLNSTNFKSDSFIVDVERLPLLNDKDTTANSRLSLQRSLSRKVSQQKGSEKKINPSIGSNGKDNNGGVATSSPRAALATPEKPMVVSVGTTDQPECPHVHHQITIITGARTPGVRRFGYRRSSPSWAIDPRRIPLFFATLSSMGTVLLIYFTLSMGKHGGDDSFLN